MKGDGGDVWKSYKDGRGVTNKAACMIYGVELQNRNVVSGCAHLQKQFRETEAPFL